MNLVLKEFDAGNVVFMTPIKNIIMKGTFCRLLYTTNIFTTNGFYIQNVDFAQIERDILTAYGCGKSHHLYFRHYTPRSCLIKVSGVWESTLECGMVYKVIHQF
jgi:hypothetical protein